MNWKAEIVKLRDNAHAVIVHAPAPQGLGAREVARVLSGVTSVIARRHGVEAMQRACAELVLDPTAIASGLAVLPRGLDGVLDPAVEMIGVVSRGLLHGSSTDAVRAALSFWACESDPSVWQEVVGLAA